MAIHVHNYTIRFRIYGNEYTVGYTADNAVHALEQFQDSDDGKNPEVVVVAVEHSTWLPDSLYLSEEESTNYFLQRCQSAVTAWENYPSMPIRDRLEGVVFSVLGEIDGTGANPLSLRPVQIDTNYFDKDDTIDSVANVPNHNHDLAGALADQWNRLCAKGN